MFKKKECVAMLLAGGQGSRLYALTEFTAKPAVSFGAKYRIIDFPLSNCINSGIDTVGVLTQYQPLQLNEYIGNGQPWDLDRTFGGVTVLPPYQGKKGADWYKGTANAIYQNLKYISRYDPEYVLILSGDHIYKMDYAKMLRAHKKTGAACTISVLEVPLKEASRFGILSADENNKIFKFEEKPKNPTSTKASMGIYIFNKDVLFKYLEEDAFTQGSANDFGKNIIPTMLEKGEKMYAYNFEGYWKDVGTIKSLWEANMDLLGENPEFDIDDVSWKIRSRNTAQAPQYIGSDAVIENSVITEGCEIDGTVINCVISPGVKIEKGAVVKDSVIMQSSVIKKGARVLYSILDEEVTVGENCIIGNDKENAKDVSVVGAGANLPDGFAVEEGKIVSSDDIKGGNA
ncbi:MAG: glucose-1-phosphate adenylyltransferase [Clostridia bacterium]|nr:glucose-1-phosphate adenylyltransferase [Clostridia bacterium]